MLPITSICTNGFQSGSLCEIAMPQTEVPAIQVPTAKLPIGLAKCILKRPPLHHIHNVGTGNKKKKEKEDQGERPSKLFVEQGEMNNCSVYENADSHHNRAGTGW